MNALNGPVVKSRFWILTFDLLIRGLVVALDFVDVVVLVGIVEVVEDSGLSVEDEDLAGM